MRRALLAKVVPPASLSTESCSAGGLIAAAVGTRTLQGGTSPITDPSCRSGTRRSPIGLHLPLAFGQVGNFCADGVG